MSKSRVVVLVAIMLALLVSTLLMADAPAATATVGALSTPDGSDQSIAKGALLDKPLSISGREVYSTASSVAEAWGGFVVGLRLGSSGEALLGSVLFDDGFESGMGLWTPWDTLSWGATTYRAASGSHSAYCVGSSIAAPGPYPDDVLTAIEVGPFDLSTATTASLEFDIYLDTEEGYDWCGPYASVNDIDFYGVAVSGDSEGWIHEVLDLSVVPDGQAGSIDMVGDSSVWVAFIFESDISNQYEGAYIDNVQLVIDSGTPPEPPTVTGLAPDSGPTAGGTSVTITGTYLTGATNVTFGGSSAGFSVDSATQITAASPLHAAGSVDVRVITPGGTSANTSADDYTYVDTSGVGLSAHERVSLDSAENQGNDASQCPSFEVISGDGRYVVFPSDATNLVAGDTNGEMDVFVRDRENGTTERVSVSGGGTQGDGLSANGCISANGRFVGFASYAENLVPETDTNGEMDVFVHDRQAGTTERVSVGSTGVQGNGDCTFVSLSSDGRYVGFTSNSTNLVTGDSNGAWDVFVHDRQTGATERVSISTGGAQGSGESDYCSISADGRYVAFCSEASNLVSGDTNGVWDVFVRDRTAGTTERVSVSSGGTQGNDNCGEPAMSADGRYVAFESWSSNLVSGDGNGTIDVFVRDRTAGTTERVSVNSTETQGNDESCQPSVSADGRYVVFESLASNLVSGDTNDEWDTFVRDRYFGTTSRLSVSAAGQQGNASSYNPCISADGRYVAFGSEATNLVPNDTNAAGDVYAVLVREYVSKRGDHRYHTAQLLSQAMFPGLLPAGAGAVVAPGETFQEALCGAPLAAAYGGPVLLTPGAGLENGTKAELQRLAPDYVFVIGLSTEVAEAVRAALPAATVIGIDGSSVYAMSRMVANALEAKVGDMTGATAIITVGYNFPDAIGFSPLACSRLWPVILTDQADGSPLHTEAQLALSNLGITHALKVGTYATLPDGVTGVANLSGSDRYYTNANVATWAEASAGLTFTHTGMCTGDKFPDALAAGPYLAKDNGTLFLSPLYGPVPNPISAVINANRVEVERFTFIACIDPVISQVKALLP